MEFEADGLKTTGCSPGECWRKVSMGSESVCCPSWWLRRALSRIRRMLRHRCGMCWLLRWRRTGSWRGWRLSCARRTRGCGRRTRGRRLSWGSCVLTWRCCSGWCSGGRRSGRGRSLLAVLTPAVSGAVTRRAARGTSVVRGRGRGGGITRTCRGSRCSGISRAAGTAAPGAGGRSRCWGITGPGSSWTGR
jgi:hypothetical protein